MNLDATEPTEEAANGQPIEEKDEQQKNGHLEKSTSDNNVQNGQNNADTNHTEVSQPNKMRDNSNKAAQWFNPRYSFPSFMLQKGDYSSNKYP